jgi:hypothetical protein
MPTPKWTPGPYSIEHVDYFGDLPGLKNGTFEISNEALSDNWLGQALTIEQAQLFAAAPELYDALENAMQLLREVWRDNPNHLIWQSGPAALAKANPAKWGPGASNTPDASTKAATGSQEASGG